jgi:RHS repeat-associated protein
VDTILTGLPLLFNNGIRRTLTFYVKSTANIGAGNKITVTVDTIQGQAALGTIQTAGNNLFSEQALHYTVPTTTTGFTVTGTIKLNFTGTAPPTGSRLNFTATAGNVTCQGAQSGPSTDLYYVHADHRNTPRSITTADQQNKEVWRWENEDAFGDNQANEDPDQDNVKMEFNLRFPGQYYDRESQTHYNMMRDYDPSTGRYVQSDPIGLQGGLNTYAYVENDPIAAIDPDGQARIDFGRLLEGLKRLLTKKPAPPAPKPDPKPVTAPSRYGDCSAVQHATLQAAVEVACKTTPFSPRQSSTRTQACPGGSMRCGEASDQQYLLQRRRPRPQESRPGRSKLCPQLQGHNAFQKLRRGIQQSQQPTMLVTN